MAGRHFDRVFLRGDSKFHQHAIIAECERYGATFAFVMDGWPQFRPNWHTNAQQCTRARLFWGQLGQRTT